MVLEVLSVHPDPAILDLNADVFRQGQVGIPAWGEEAGYVVNDDVHETLGLIDISERVRNDVAHGPGVSKVWLAEARTGHSAQRGSPGEVPISILLDRLSQKGRHDLHDDLDLRLLLLLL